MSVWEGAVAYLDTVQTNPLLFLTRPFLELFVFSNYIKIPIQAHRNRK